MRRFWWRWTLGTAMGSACGGLAADLRLARMQRIVLERGMDAIQDAGGLTVAGASALVAGLMVGAIQAWLVRDHVPHLGWRWVLATLAGHLSMVRLQAVGAPVLAILQWLILRRSVPGSRAWIVASTIGWALAVVVTSRLGASGAVGGWALGLLSGAIAGAITGRTLPRLLVPSSAAAQGNAAATNASA